MKNSIIILTLLYIFNTNVYASDNGALILEITAQKVNLKECIDKALDINPTLKAAKSIVEAATQRISQAKSTYYPQVNLSAGLNRISPVPSITADKDSSKSYTQYAIGASLKQMIYDFGKTDTQVNIQNINKSSYEADFAALKEQIILNVKQNYYSVLQAKRNKEIALESLVQYQKHLDQADSFFNIGLKPRFDVTKAEADLSSAKVELIKADNALKIAIIGLNNAVGYETYLISEIEDDLNYSKYDILESEAVNKAYKNRQDMLSLNRKKKAAEENISLIKKNYYPYITGDIAYNRSGDDIIMKDGWSAGINLTMPLFNGNLTKFQISEAVANYNTIKANEDVLKQVIYLEVKQAYLKLKEAEERIPASEAALKKAKENFLIAEGRYSAGVGNPIEVTDAQTIYNTAKSSHIQALHDYKIAIAVLEKAMGGN